MTFAMLYDQSITLASEFYQSVSLFNVQFGSSVKYLVKLLSKCYYVYQRMFSLE